MSEIKRTEQDIELNRLAVEYAGGSQEAGDKFFEIVLPILAKYARRTYSQVEKEVLTQELALEAMEACRQYGEKYHTAGGNVMGLVWTMCKRRVIDLGRFDNRQRRAEWFEHAGDKVNRTFSLFAQDENNSLLIDRVGNGEKSVEEVVFENQQKEELLDIVKEFTYRAKGRNKLIVPIVYTAVQLGWDEDYLQARIGDAIEDETGSYPSNAVIRKAKSRAINALRTFMEQGDNYFLAEELGF